MKEEGGTITYILHKHKFTQLTFPPGSCGCRSIPYREVDHKLVTIYPHQVELLLHVPLTLKTLNMPVCATRGGTRLVTSTHYCIHQRHYCTRLLEHWSKELRRTRADAARPLKPIKGLRRALCAMLC